MRYCFHNWWSILLNGGRVWQEVRPIPVNWTPLNSSFILYTFLFPHFFPVKKNNFFVMFHIPCFSCFLNIFSFVLQETETCGILHRHSWQGGVGATLERQWESLFHLVQSQNSGPPFHQMTFAGSSKLQSRVTRVDLYTNSQRLFSEPPNPKRIKALALNLFYAWQCGCFFFMLVRFTNTCIVKK